MGILGVQKKITVMFQLIIRAIEWVSFEFSLLSKVIGQIDFWYLNNCQKESWEIFITCLTFLNIQIPLLLENIYQTMSRIFKDGHFFYI